MHFPIKAGLSTLVLLYALLDKTTAAIHGRIPLPGLSPRQAPGTGPLAEAVFTSEQECAGDIVVVPITQANGECIADSGGADFTVLSIEIAQPGCALTIFRGNDCDASTGALVEDNSPVCASPGGQEITSIFVNCSAPN